MSLVRYNWPLYVVCLSVLVLGMVIFAMTRLPFPVRLLALTAACVASWYAVASFFAFYLMFDRPKFLGGEWLTRCVTSPPQTCVQISVCVEETTLPLQQVFPESKYTQFDLFDSEVMTEPAINRAKHEALTSANAIAKADLIPLDAGLSEFTLVTLAAHEIRNPRLRHNFFAELRRITASNGCVVIAEHLRNLPAALAFGPGLFHFYPRSEWITLATASGLRVHSEFDINPFIHVFVLHHN
jgi:hypothetical protein